MKRIENTRFRLRLRYSILTFAFAFAYTFSFAQRDEIITDTSNTQGWFYGLKAANLKSNNKVTYTDPLGNVRVSAIDVASLGDQLNDGFITGGIVTYSGTGLTFDVTAAVYYINGTRYTSNAGSITLTAADATNDRIDVIALDNTGTIVKITGTASANPIEPQIDPNTQIKLTSIYVPAGSTTPSNVTSNIVYDENVEWAATTSGTIAVNFNGTTNNFHGSKNTTVTSWANGSQIIYINSGTITVSGTNTLKAFFRLSNALTSGQNIFAQLYNGGNSVSGTVNLSSYGLNRSSVGAYQNVSIPFNAFKLKSNTFDRVVFAFTGSNGNIVNLDYVQVQGGITTSTNSIVDSLTYATRFWTTSNFQPKGNYLTSQVNSDWNATSGAAQIFNKPTIAAQFNPIQGANMSITGTYPNITFAVPSLSQTQYQVVVGTGTGMTSSPNLIYDNSQFKVIGTGINYDAALRVENLNDTARSGKNMALFYGSRYGAGDITDLSNVGIFQKNTTYGAASALTYYTSNGEEAVMLIGRNYGNGQGYHTKGEFSIAIADKDSTRLGLQYPIVRFLLDSTGQMYLSGYKGIGIRNLAVNDSGKIVIGSGTVTGTSYTEYKEEKTNVTGTTITLTHTPAFPASVLLFYNDGNSTQIQRQQWYTISGTTLTLNFTPTASNYFIIKYSY